jgi:hypothetical protein
MKTPFVSSLLALLSVASPAFAGPEPGHYAGTVTVSRVLGEEGLMSQFSLRVQARIKADGSMTILSSAPELPRIATVEDAITRAVPVTPAPIPHQPEMPVLQPLVTPMPSLTPSIFPAPIFQRGNYLVDGQHPAFVSVKGRVVTLRYQNPARTVPEVVIQDGVAVAHFQFAPPAVSFVFTLKKTAK